MLNYSELKHTSCIGSPIKKEQKVPISNTPFTLDILM